ncbi:CUB domain [Trinorchestia longiramus]|nr:CUB domain [Trinorchestia longiramus]
MGVAAGGRRTAPATVNARLCGEEGELTPLEGGQHAVITSPNYPYNYPPNTTCTWRFQVIGDGVLRLQCPKVMLSRGTSFTINGY